MLKPDDGLVLEAECSESDVESDAVAGSVSLVALANLVWELRDVMSRVRPEDLSAAEVAALLGILTPAQSRVIGRPAAGPRLRIVRYRCDHSAPDLA
jgi:hypothetical protein